VLKCAATPGLTRQQILQMRNQARADNQI
jgi:hypothetical protein